MVLPHQADAFFTDLWNDGMANAAINSVDRISHYHIDPFVPPLQISILLLKFHLVLNPEVREPSRKQQSFCVQNLADNP